MHRFSSIFARSQLIRPPSKMFLIDLFHGHFHSHQPQDIDDWLRGVEGRKEGETRSLVSQSPSVGEEGAFLDCILAPKFGRRRPREKAVYSARACTVHLLIL